MDLIHNRVFTILTGELGGIYRTVFGVPELGKTIVVRIGDLPTSADEQKAESASGSEAKAKAKKKRRKKSLPLVGALLWIDTDVLTELARRHELKVVELVLDGRYYNTTVETLRQGASDKAMARFKRKQQLLDTRVRAMSPFLNLDTLRESILEHGNLSALVEQVAHKKRNALNDEKATREKETTSPDRPTISRGLTYKCWSLLCMFGFDESSLKLRYHLSGAPGLLRPCDPGGNKKAGTWTHAQRQAAAAGLEHPPPEQPGTSSEWRALIMIGDAKIPSPKPPWRRRYAQIIEHSFVRQFKDDGGKLVPVYPPQGTYPNKDQVQRVVKVDTPRLILLRQKTTEGHFTRSLRGLKGTNWQGVAGPGHTFAIDSTVGDVYLRSSINRAWIIGRPIVYVLVDVWSTAIVGFYVCLHGPSWDMAKISLFCAGADPALIADLWGYTYIPTLVPRPTLPFILMCDRGEYLSRAARQTGIDLRLHESFAPPYRPDLKGLVEVLHRIAKDEQFRFLPGAIDARRIEMELRKFDPRHAVFTVREYVHYLYTLFNNYNLTADRKHRLDAHMLADDVVPSPAGLWRWGHGVGLGYQRDVLLPKLITDLLPRGRMSVTPKGVIFARASYGSRETELAEWTAHARNFGSERAHCHYFPGTASRIWTPNLEGKGIFDLALSDQSTVSPELTFDEAADAYAYSLRLNAKREHERTMKDLDYLAQCKAMFARATELTAEAIARQTGSAPTMTEARAFEASPAPPPISSSGSKPPAIAASEEVDEIYSEMMGSILNTPGKMEFSNA